MKISTSSKILVLRVMTQKHNRHMPFSLYISVLAITDTISLLIGEHFNSNNNKRTNPLCGKNTFFALLQHV